MVLFLQRENDVDCAAASVCVHPRLGRTDNAVEYELGLTKDQCEAIESCTEYCYSCESLNYVNGACYNDLIDETACGTYTNCKIFLP